MKLLNVIGNESWYIDNKNNVNGNLEFLLDLKKYVFMYCVDFWIVFDVYFFIFGIFVLDIEGKIFSMKGGYSFMFVIC